jgi:hypothetical protein
MIRFATTGGSRVGKRIALLGLRDTADTLSQNGPCKQSHGGMDLLITTTCRAVFVFVVLAVATRRIMH